MTKFRKFWRTTVLYERWELLGWSVLLLAGGVLNGWLWTYGWYHR